MAGQMQAHKYKKIEDTGLGWLEMNTRDTLEDFDNILLFDLGFGYPETLIFWKSSIIFSENAVHNYQTEEPVTLFLKFASTS